MKKLLILAALLFAFSIFAGGYSLAHATTNTTEAIEHTRLCATDADVLFRESITRHSHLIARFAVFYSERCRTAWSRLDVYTSGNEWETGAYIERSDGAVELTPHSRQHHVVTPLLYVPRHQMIQGCPYLVDIVHLREYGQCSPWMKA